MRRPVGLDINGWHDFACRDWSADDPDKRTDSLNIVDGGFASVVVTDESLTVSGPQAILSPIGRGSGWGRIGAIEKRRRLADLWRGLLAGRVDQSFRIDLRTAADTLSVKAEELVLCIPDRAEMNEAGQDALLTTLAGGRRPHVTLLWRSVALLLDLLDGGALPGARDGQHIACIVHGQDGLEVQQLVLRRLPECPDWLAPERAGPGRVCCPELGLSSLAEQAGAAVAHVNPRLAGWRGEVPRLPFALLFGEQTLIADEVIRADNGNWELARAPSSWSFVLPQGDLAGLGESNDLAVVLSPLAERHRRALTEWLVQSLPQISVLAADPCAAARGALRAARRDSTLSRSSRSDCARRVARGHTPLRALGSAGRPSARQRRIRVAADHEPGVDRRHGADEFLYPQGSA